MRNFFACFIFVLLFVSNAVAQNKVTLSGYVKDVSSGETLPGAAIYIIETGQGIGANNYGFYSISMPAGSYTVRVSYVGYQNFEEKINLIASRSLNIDMSGDFVETEGVTITDVRKDENVTSTQVGTVTISAETVKKLPVVFGESDVLKAIQLMPGVQSSGEGQVGFYVRGGGPDQNMVLLDDAVVYNTGHLFGFFSVFNTDAIKNVTLIKGGMPANYGGRLSSVLDVSMKDGSMKSYHGEGGIGLIASRLTLEGPIVKDKGSFIISGRRTYIDAITKPFFKEQLNGSGYYFYDANVKANYRLSDKDRIYLSGYFGRDVFTFNSQSGNFNAHIPWGNATGTFRWNHQFNDKLFLNTTVVYNDYKFEFNAGQKDMAIKFYSGIQDWNAKMDFDYYTINNHHVKFGAGYTYHTFIPNQVSGNSAEEEFDTDNALKKYAHEAGIYLTDEFGIGEKIKMNAGVRYSLFAQAGPYADYKADINGNKVDSVVYPNRSDIVKTYGGWEPRLNVRFTINSNSSIKASVTKTHQYIHLVANNGTTLPTDLWVPSTTLVQPQSSWQYSAGYFHNLLDNMVETSVEIYYKNMSNQIEYRSGYTPASFRDVELDFVFGKGYAYGAEFFVNKTKGNFTGWIGYTLSWTWREFLDLNNGKRFPAKYDRRHDLSVVLNYTPNNKWNFSSVFVYGTGNAITLPTGYYFIDQNLIQDYSELNQYRIFPYHRLDLSAIWTPNPDSKRRWKSSWAFSIYNVYNRYNPYILYVDTEGSLSQGSQVKVKQVSIFPILPSITYNFKF